jgi:hypothetical protein
LVITCLTVETNAIEGGAGRCPSINHIRPSRCLSHLLAVRIRGIPAAVIIIPRRIEDEKGWAGSSATYLDPIPGILPSQVKRENSSCTGDPKHPWSIRYHKPSRRRAPRFSAKLLNWMSGSSNKKHVTNWRRGLSNISHGSVISQVEKKHLFRFCRSERDSLLASSVATCTIIVISSAHHVLCQDQLTVFEGRTQ